MKQIITAAIYLLVVLTASSVKAGEADVLDVEVNKATNGTYTFNVTIFHADEGWGHYADAFEIISPDGKVVGQRVLAHPHVNEQPFTRSLGHVVISEKWSFVTVRARDKVHGQGGKVMQVPLNGRELNPP